jgi:hypothetical protein
MSQRLTVIGDAVSLALAAARPARRWVVGCIGPGIGAEPLAGIIRRLYRAGALYVVSIAFDHFEKSKDFIRGGLTARDCEVLVRRQCGWREIAGEFVPGRRPPSVQAVAGDPIQTLSTTVPGLLPFDLLLFRPAAGRKALPWFLPLWEAGLLKTAVLALDWVADDEPEFGSGPVLAEALAGGHQLARLSAADRSARGRSVRMAVCVPPPAATLKAGDGGDAHAESGG